MLFDEPTSALDPEMINEVLDVMTGARPRRHDDDRRHPRDGLRPPRGQPGRLHGRRPDRRGRADPDEFFTNPRPTGPRTSSPRSSPTDLAKGSTHAADRTTSSPPYSRAGRPAARRRRLWPGRRLRRVRATAPPSHRAPSDAELRRPARRWPSWHEAGKITRRHQVRPAASACKGLDGKPEGFDVEIAKIIAGEARHPGRQDHLDRDAVEDPRGRHRATARSTWWSRPTRSTTPASRTSPSPGRTTWPARTSWSQGRQHDDHRAGRRSRPRKKVCSVSGSTPAKNITKYVGRRGQLVLFDVYSKCVDALQQRPGRRRHHRQRHPAGLRRPSRGRVQAGRQAVHQGALRHRREEGRHRVPQLHQRHAGEGLRRRHATPRPGTRTVGKIERHRGPRPPPVDRY